MTRNQKKNQQTQEKNNVSNPKDLIEKTMENKENQNDSVKPIEKDPKENNKPSSETLPKKRKIEPTPVSSENNKKQKKNNPVIPRGMSGGLMPMTMPINFLFYNIRNKKKKNDDRDESSDDEDNEDKNDDNDEDDNGECNCGECDECEELDDDYEDEEDDDLDEFFDFNNRIKEVRKKIIELNISDEQKDRLTNMLKNSNLDEKRMEWFDTLTKIPFGNYSKYDVNIENMDETRNFIKDVYSNLENSVWGMRDVKEEILNYVSQCIIQPNGKPRVLALHGEPGIGKTKIVRDGISTSLNREMRCFSMGGIKDSSTFFGFDYTYVGSKHGAIVQALIDTKTMNPILFFDELDKISETKDGKDIENLLIHLTDPVQNYDFNDKYFSGFPIDISKSLIIFSFNDIDNISPILRDRLHIINIPSPSPKDKINIAQKYFVKEFVDNFKLNNELTFTDDIVKHIVDRYTNEESGVRRLKRCIETICMKVNTSKLLGSCLKDMNLSTSKLNITLPLTLTKEHIDTLLHVKETKNDKIPFMYI